MAVFWDVVPCSPVDNDRPPRGAFCFHYEGNMLDDSHLILRYCMLPSAERLQKYSCGVKGGKREFFERMYQLFFFIHRLIK
jgi:hypothetical protein